MRCQGWISAALPSRRSCVWHNPSQRPAWGVRGRDPACAAACVCEPTLGRVCVWCVCTCVPGDFFLGGGEGGRLACKHPHVSAFARVLVHIHECVR